MDHGNHYEVLGVSNTASAAEIKAAYRSRLKTAHPDHGGSTELAARLNEAGDVLTDEKRRAAYDRDLRDRARRAGAAASTRRPEPPVRPTGAPSAPKPPPTPTPPREMRTATILCPNCGRKNRLQEGPDIALAKCGACGEPFRRHDVARDSYVRIFDDLVSQWGEKLFGEKFHQARSAAEELLEKADDRFKVTERANDAFQRAEDRLKEMDAWMGKLKDT